jgi:hypothetical protein
MRLCAMPPKNAAGAVSAVMMPSYINIVVPEKRVLLNNNNNNYKKRVVKFAMKDII